jgi:hypothetical protein
VASRDSTDTRTHGFFWGVGLGRRASEIDADHEAFLADLEDVRETRNLVVEAGAQGGDLRGQVGDGLLALEEIERGQCSGTAESVAAKTVAVKEGQAFLRQAEELTEDLVGGHGCCHGEVSSTQALGESE